MQAEPFVTIAEFVMPSDLLVARGRLEYEGIECALKDEMTVQVHNFMSQAVGGVKLQVRGSEAEHARALLIEWGLLLEGEPETSNVWSELDEWTRTIPLIGRLDLLIARLVVLVAIVLVLILVPIGFSMQPTAQDLLVKGNWCVDRMEHDGSVIKPLTIGLRMVMGCTEEIHFGEKGDVQLPGFDSPAQVARWSLADDRIWIDQLDTLLDVYAEPFSFAVSDRELTLRSARTTIYCTHVRSEF